MNKYDRTFQGQSLTFAQYYSLGLEKVFNNYRKLFPRLLNFLVFFLLSFTIFSFCLTENSCAMDAYERLREENLKRGLRGYTPKAVSFDIHALRVKISRSEEPRKTSLLRHKKDEAYFILGNGARDDKSIKKTKRIERKAKKTEVEKEEKITGPKRSEKKLDKGGISGPKRPKKKVGSTGIGPYIIPEGAQVHQIDCSSSLICARSIVSRPQSMTAASIEESSDVIVGDSSTSSSSDDAEKKEKTGKPKE